MYPHHPENRTRPPRNIHASSNSNPAAMIRTSNPPMTKRREGSSTGSGYRVRRVGCSGEDVGMSSRWSIRSSGSVLSIASTDSVLSIASVGSVLSLGSVASFGSVGSFASSMSTLSAASFQSQGSVLSGQSDGSVLSWQSKHAVEGNGDSGRLDPVVVAGVAAASTVLAAAIWLYARRRA
jgi:hypothetical protein